MHMKVVTDIEFICIEYTLIVLRNNLHIPIETTEVLKNTYLHNHDFAELVIAILIVYDVHVLIN